MAACATSWTVGALTRQQYFSPPSTSPRADCPVTWRSSPLLDLWQDLAVMGYSRLQRTCNTCSVVLVAFGGPFGGFISNMFDWRCAFLLQLPLFFLSFVLTSINLNYVTPVCSVHTIATRAWSVADFFEQVFALLVFRSTRYGEEYHVVNEDDDEDEKLKTGGPCPR